MARTKAGTLMQRTTGRTLLWVKSFSSISNVSRPPSALKRLSGEDEEREGGVSCRREQSLGPL